MAKKLVKKSPPQANFDTMSVTVLLVMAIFGGLIGFYLGRGSASPQVVSLKEAGVMMKEKGMMMEDAGRIMEAKGLKFKDTELTEKGKMMMEGGSVLSGKGVGMMGITQDYR